MTDRLSQIRQEIKECQIKYREQQQQQATTVEPRPMSIPSLVNPSPIQSSHPSLNALYDETASVFDFTKSAIIEKCLQKERASKLQKEQEALAPYFDMNAEYTNSNENPLLKPILTTTFTSSITTTTTTTTSYSVPPKKRVQEQWVSSLPPLPPALNGDWTEIKSVIYRPPFYGMNKEQRDEAVRKELLTGIPTPDSLTPVTTTTTVTTNPVLNINYNRHQSATSNLTPPEARKKKLEQLSKITKHRRSNAFNRLKRTVTNNSLKNLEDIDKELKEHERSFSSWNQTPSRSSYLTDDMSKFIVDDRSHRNLADLYRKIKKDEKSMNIHH